MSIRTCKPRRLDPDSSENRFHWIVEEVARIRHHQSRYNDEGRMMRSLANRPVPHPSTLRSLRSTNVRHVSLLVGDDESGLDAPGEYVFEVSKARKL
jgi:hypothetical protein